MGFRAVIRPLRGGVGGSCSVRCSKRAIPSHPPLLKVDGHALRFLAIGPGLNFPEAQQPLVSSNQYQVKDLGGGG